MGTSGTPIQYVTIVDRFGAFFYYLLFDNDYYYYHSYLSDHSALEIRVRLTVALF